MLLLTLLLMLIEENIFTILCVLVLCLFVYRNVYATWWYFSDRNIKFIRGWPVFGVQNQLFKSKAKRMSLADQIRCWYNWHPTEKIIGLYEIGGSPVFMLRDPELIKQVTIKDFDHFLNHRFALDEKADPILGRSLFFKGGAQWKSMRATLSPAFTGSKMRMMFTIMNESSEKFVDYLSESNGNVAFDYEMKDLFTRYASDVIASCAFGLELNSMKDKENDFYKTGKIVTDIKGWKILRFLAVLTIPRITRLFGIRISDEKYSNFFSRYILDAMRYREENNIVRHDIVNMLMEAKRQGYIKSQLNENPQDEIDGFATVQESSHLKTGFKMQWTDEDIVAQCMGFFLAGYDTVSALMCFTAHELAVNPDIQHKLYEEIKSTQKNNAFLNYKTLGEMNYMDMVISESLRKWTPSPITDRRVTKSCALEISSGHVVNLNVGDIVSIPLHSIHLDAKYFPNPNRFDPERFSKDNVDSIQSGTYMPFGVGPRNCIGSRFALMETKLIIYHLLNKFELRKCGQTQDPLRLALSTISMHAEKGFWLELVPRT